MSLVCNTVSSKEAAGVEGALAVGGDCMGKGEARSADKGDANGDDSVNRDVVGDGGGNDVATCDDVARDSSDSVTGWPLIVR